MPRDETYAGRDAIVAAHALGARRRHLENEGYKDRMERMFEEQQSAMHRGNLERIRSEKNKGLTGLLGLAGTVAGMGIGAATGGGAMGAMMGGSIGGGIGREAGALSSGNATGQYLMQGMAPAMQHMARQSLMDKYYGNMGGGDSFGQSWADQGMADASQNASLYGYGPGYGSMGNS